MEAEGACIIRRDRSILLECAHTGFAAAREKLSVFAELVKSPPVYHTYRITMLSLWNAASLGFAAEEILSDLRLLSRWEIPSGLEDEIVKELSNYGRLSLHTDADDPSRLLLKSDQQEIMDELERHSALLPLCLQRVGSHELSARAEIRGQIKQSLARLGYPVMDYAGYREGQALKFAWHDSFKLRDYQKEALEHFEGKSGSGGSGVVVLPCGAGKTVVGLAVMEALQCETLILTSNTTSVRQWKDELTQRTHLSESEVGEYTGDKREVRPVTVATYQILTHRRSKTGAFQHMKLFGERNWGLIIYDEVHLLPAPVFRVTADIQATRRLGLTATLVREDGREGDVFSLIGPKRYDLPWKVLEKEGWIARVKCIECIVPMNDSLQERYRYAAAKEQFQLAAVNTAKIKVVQQLMDSHKGDAILIIGQYIQQLLQVSAELGAPLITGKTPQQERLSLYSAFNEGELPVLIVSKVANFAVNLPDATVAIQISGAFGSRQEEAQRLGRILRPKAGENKAYFYTLVTGDSREQDFSLRRRMFLTEQGYSYEIRHAELNGVESI